MVREMCEDRIIANRPAKGETTMEKTDDKTSVLIEPKHPTGDSFLNALADLLLYLDQQATPQTEQAAPEEQTTP